MPRAVRPQRPTAPPIKPAWESSFMNLLSGWVQQGAESFIATQKILVDLVVRQNVNAKNLIRERLSDPENCPMAMLTELGSEGLDNFYEAHKTLSHLAQQENELLMNGVKERVEGFAPAVALTDLVRRTIDTLVDMQHGYVKLANHHAQSWIEGVKEGSFFDLGRVTESAREGIDIFVRSQKKFLDAISEETAHAAGHGKPDKAKKMELMELARKSSETFIEAERRLLELAGKQMNANLKAAGRTVNMVRTGSYIPLVDLTREGVKNFVDAEKALINKMKKPVKVTPQARRKVRRPIRPVRPVAVSAGV